MYLGFVREFVSKRLDEWMSPGICVKTSKKDTMTQIPVSELVYCWKICRYMRDWICFVHIRKEMITYGLLLSFSLYI